MSVKVMALVWDKGPFEGGSLLVMLALADWANDEGACWPSVPTVAHKARMGDRNARYILKNLEADNWIIRDEARGRTHSNTYTLNLQKLQVLPTRKKVQKLQVLESENLQSATVKPAICDIKPAIAIAPEPSIEPSEEEPPRDETRARAEGEPPDWIPAALWKRWLKFRKEINHPIKVTQAEAQFKHLDKLRGRGHPPEEVIEQSIAHGWQGLFELKELRNGNGKGQNEQLQRGPSVSPRSERQNRNASALLNRASELREGAEKLRGGG